MDENAVKRNDRPVAMCALLSVALLFWAIAAHPQSTGDPRLDVRMGSSGNGYTFTITNLGGIAVTAYVAKAFFPQNKREQVLRTWDSVLADEAPIEPNGHVSGGIGVSENDPYPDRVEVVAGIWSDGETFGKEVYLKQLLDAREKRASEFESVAKLIQRGLDENWSVDQYLHALDVMPSSLAVYSLSSTLKAGSKSDDPKRLHHTVLHMLDMFTGSYERIRRAKPAISATTNP